MIPGLSGPSSGIAMPRSTVAAVLIAWSLAIAPAVARTHSHAGPPDHATTSKLAGVPAHRWATDAPLRAGMRDIRAVVEALGHYEHGHVRPQGAVTLAGQVDTHIAGIVANCRLQPEADAALHEVLAALSRGAAALESDPSDVAPIQAMRHALAEYTRLFDDPAFQLPSA